MKKIRKFRKIVKAPKIPGTPALRWAIIHVTMPSPNDLERGMEIATEFEERHGNKPPMYFARYTDDNTIRITVLTTKTDKELKKLFKKLGVFKVTSATKGGGSWEHCHMFQVAKHVFGKRPLAVQDVVHWLHNMINYNYLQECANHVEQSAYFLTNMVRRPHEEPKTQPGEPAKG